MRNPWKYATVGILAVALTAATSSVMTAYVMRPVLSENQRSVPESDAVSEAQSAAVERPGSVPGPAPRRVIMPQRLAMVRGGAGEPTPATAVTSASPTPATPSAGAHSGMTSSAPAVVRTDTLPSAPVAAAPAPVTAPTTSPVVDPAPTAAASPSVPADCTTGGDRAWRIAKPGGVGGLLGAAVGAAGGAIADGGKGAGKGALIGAGVGAVAGGTYGAYKTQKECGTIFGASSGFGGGGTSTPSSGPGRPETPQAGLPSSAVRHSTPDAEAIAIYDVR